LHQATRAFFAWDPIVDVALNQEFFANGAPQRKDQASLCVSLSGTVEDTRVLALLAVQLGRGVTAFAELVKLE